MQYETIVFQDREDAGRRLAGQLSKYKDENPVVLALPRGGVPVGYEVSRALEAPLDVVVARKLGAPGQPELAMGAIAPGGVRVLNENVVRWLDVSEGQIESSAAKELEEAERRTRLFRGERSGPEIEDRSVILVDDGIATGMTVRAAIRAVRAQGPRRVILAVPVCARETMEKLADEVDETVCLVVPEELWAIGLWYRDFRQVSDEEVAELLERDRSNREQRS